MHEKQLNYFCFYLKSKIKRFWNNVYYGFYRNKGCTILSCNWLSDEHQLGMGENKLQKAYFRKLLNLHISLNPHSTKMKSVLVTL